MTISKYFWQFLVFSLVSLTAGFFLQSYYVGQGFEDLMIKSYTANLLMATSVFLIIEKLKKNQKSILGYVFLGGSTFKFFIYFVYIYPLILETGEFTKPKFFMFFIPYGICLIVEVIFLVRLLGDDD